MPDVDAVIAAMNRAIEDLAVHPQSDTFTGTVAAATFLFGRFLQAVDGPPRDGRRGFTPEQLRAMVDGGVEVWEKGRARRGPFLLIVERGRVGGILVRVERVS